MRIQALEDHEFAGKVLVAILPGPVTVIQDNVKQTVIKDGFQNLEMIQKSLV